MTSVRRAMKAAVASARSPEIGSLSVGGSAGSELHSLKRTVDPMLILSFSISITLWSLLPALLTRDDGLLSVRSGVVARHNGATLLVAFGASQAAIARLQSPDRCRADFWPVCKSASSGHNLASVLSGEQAYLWIGTTSGLSSPSTAPVR